MENKDFLSNPFYNLARDILPFTCEKYGLDRVIAVLELCCLAGLPPEPTTAVLDKIFPLTEEEGSQENAMVHNNMLAYALFSGETNG